MLEEKYGEAAMKEIQVYGGINHFVTAIRVSMKIRAADGHQIRQMTRTAVTATITASASACTQ
jgi:hypothetical protein